MPAHLYQALVDGQGTLDSTKGDALYLVDSGETLLFGTQDVSNLSVATIRENEITLHRPTFVTDLPNAANPVELYTAPIFDVSGNARVQHTLHGTRLQGGPYGSQFNPEINIQAIGERNSTIAAGGYDVCGNQAGIKMEAMLDPFYGKVSSKLTMQGGTQTSVSMVTNAKDTPITVTGLNVFSMKYEPQSLDPSQVETENSGLPRTTCFSNGNYLTLWINNSSIYVQRWYPDGTPQDMQPLVVSSDVNATTKLGDVTATTNDGFVIVWEHEGSIWAKHYTVNLHTNQSQIIHPQPGTQTDPRIVSLRNNEVGILYSHSHVNSTLPLEKYLVYYELPVKNVLALDTTGEECRGFAFDFNQSTTPNYAYTTGHTYPPNQALTYAAWIKTTINDANPRSIIWVGNVNTHRQLFIQNGTLGFSMDRNQTQVTGTQGISDGEWHFVACTLTADDPATIHLYVDGSLDTTGTLTRTVYTNPNFRLAADVSDNTDYAQYNENRLFHGKMDQAMLFQEALSANTIVELYNERRVLSPKASSASSSLFAWWKMDRIQLGVDTGAPIALPDENNQVSLNLYDIDTAITTLIPATTRSVSAYSADIGVFINGSKARVWQSQGDIYLQVQTPTEVQNNIQTAPVLVNTVTAETQQNPKVTVLPTGRTLVTWESFNQDGDQWGVYAKLFDTHLAELTGDVLVNTTVLLEQSHHSEFVLKNGTVVIAWEDYTGGLNDPVYIKYRRFDHNFEPLDVSENKATVLTLNQERHPYVGSFPGGSFAIAFNALQGSTWNVYVRHFQANGIGAGSEYIVNSAVSSPNDPEIEPRVMTLTDGTIAIVWKGAPGTYENQIFVRYRNANLWLTNPIAINAALYRTSVDQVLTRFEIQADQDNGFFLTWEFSNPTGPTSAVFVTRVNNSGTLDVSASQITPNDGNIHELAHMALGRNLEIQWVVSNTEIRSALYSPSVFTIRTDDVFQAANDDENLRSLEFKRQLTFLYNRQLPLIDQPMTIAVWMKTAGRFNDSNPHYLFSLGGVRTRRSLALTDTELIITTRGVRGSFPEYPEESYSAKITGQSVVNIMDGQWHQIAMSYVPQEGKATLYIDANQVAQWEDLLYPTPIEGWQLESAIIGATTMSPDFIAPDPSSIWVGNVDDVVIWSEAISLARLKHSYNQGCSATITSYAENTGVFGWWTQDDVSSNTMILNRAGSDNPMYLYGFDTSMNLVQQPQQITNTVDPSENAPHDFTANRFKNLTLTAWIEKGNEIRWAIHDVRALLDASGAFNPESGGIFEAVRVTYLPRSDFFILAWMEASLATHYTMYARSLSFDGTLGPVIRVDTMNYLSERVPSFEVAPINQSGFLLRWDNWARQYDSDFLPIGPEVQVIADSDALWDATLTEMVPTGLAGVGMYGGEVKHGVIAINGFRSDSLVYPNTMAVMRHVNPVTKYDLEYQKNMMAFQNDTGYIGINLAQPEYDLDVNGTIRAKNIIMGDNELLPNPASITNGQVVAVKDGRYQTKSIVSGTTRAEFTQIHGVHVDGTEYLRGALIPASTYDWTQGWGWKTVLLDSTRVLAFDNGETLTDIPDTVLTEGKDLRRIEIELDGTADPDSVFVIPGNTLEPREMFAVGQLVPSTSAASRFIQKAKRDFDWYSNERLAAMNTQETGEFADASYIAASSHVSGTNIYRMDFLVVPNPPVYSLAEVAATRYTTLRGETKAERKNSHYVYSGDGVRGGVGTYDASNARGLYPYIATKRWDNVVEGTIVKDVKYQADPSDIYAKYDTELDWLYELYKMTYLSVVYGSSTAVPDGTDTVWSTKIATAQGKGDVNGYYYLYVTNNVGGAFDTEFFESTGRVCFSLAAFYDAFD